MSRPNLTRAALALLMLFLVPAVAMAAGMGTVTKVLRPQVHTFDDKGQPTGTLAAGSAGAFSAGSAYTVNTNGTLDINGFTTSVGSPFR